MRGRACQPAPFASYDGMKPLPFLVVLAALLLGGCASYNAQVDPGVSLAQFQRFYVQSNLNDNHAVDALLARTLTGRGLTATHGPLTMMPADTEAIVTYQERWAWDFGDHLVYLRVAVRDAKTGQPISSAMFNGPVALNKDPADVVNRLIRELLERK